MIKIGHTTIEAVLGDIANQTDIKAVVNAANAELLPGSGVAGALHKAAGPGLAEECRPLAPIAPGEAVITKAHNLPNDFVIHCLGPVYFVDKPEDQLLANCYRNAIRLAEENSITSLAFPAISTGAFGYPFDPATDIALVTIRELCPGLKNLQLIRFVLFSEEHFKEYERKLEDLKT